MIKQSKAYQYCLWCLEKGNNKVPIYVKKQAKAWIKIADGKDEEAYINEERFELICNLLKVINHPDLLDSLYNTIEMYAWFFITAIFCTYWKNDKIKRYYQTATLKICRKNYKTFYSAVIFIIGMLTEPKFSRFYSVAPDFKLSSELKVAVRKIIAVSPALQDRFKVMRDMVKCSLTDIEYTPLAYSNDKMDGKLANMFLADEAGAMDSYPIEAMRSSQIILKNKLGIIISTEYPNDNNGFLDEVDIAKKTLDGLMDRKNYFSLIYEPNSDIQKEWEKNDDVIYQSNPVAVDNAEVFQAIKDKRTMAILYENKRENYLCKHNNIPYKGLGVEGFIEITKVRECKTKEDLSFWNGRRVYLGLDLSQSDDNTAVAMVTYDDDVIYSKVFGFLPAEKVEIKSLQEKVDYRQLAKNGDCFPCGGEIIDYRFVEGFILSIEKKYNVEIVQLAFDRWNAISTVQKLESAENPIECVEVKQHSSVLHIPTKLLKEKILSKKFRYDENKLLEINFQNARCTEDTNLNQYVNKKKSNGKVDMVVALINAIYLLNVNELLEQEQSWGVQY